MKRKVIRGAVVFFILLAMVITQSISVNAAASKFVTRVNTTSKVVALTFDDGADGANTNKILDILATNNVKATFFLTCSSANNHPQYSELLTTYLLHKLKWELLGKTVLLPATVIYQARRAVPALNGCQSANINRLRLALMSRS